MHAYALLSTLQVINQTVNEEHNSESNPEFITYTRYMEIKVKRIQKISLTFDSGLPIPPCRF